ncbi:MAG: hypothetical protein V3T72_12625 [Thermoanaerobaculia bacterium]
MCFGIVFQSLPVLYDTDSYYHLAIARTYARDGIVEVLPWARLSLLHDFGDKEILFHLLLAPFADTADPTAGGRWALALLNAMLAAALASLGFAAVGRWGLLTPALIYGGSLDFLGRLIRLRPEVLSLLLLLAAVWCAGRRKYRWLGLIAALYALSYTAFHAFLGLTLAWFAQQWWNRGRREWKLLLYSILGLGLGLVAHPHFPRNLVVWKVQSVDFFQQKGLLNVGAEIGAHSAPDLLWLNLAWIVGLWALWRSCRFQNSRREDATADLLWVTAAVFGALYLLMLRFSVYFIPFATLAVLFEIRRRGGVLTAATALPWSGGRRELHLALFVVAALVLGVPRSIGLLHDLSQEGGPISREAEWRAFGHSLPPGARVAAEWGSTHIYMFWAPQATFLNVLDPVFMNVRHPRAYRALRAIFEDREPDVPRALKAELGCDFLALSRFHQPPGLLRRLDGDPRLRSRYRGYTLLYELVPGANQAFILDWRLVPEGADVPPPATDVATFPRVPRAATAELRALEGYVDPRRGGVPIQGCVAMVHELEAVEEATPLFELAASGPTSLWVDDELRISSADTTGAYPGGGVSFPVRLDPGSHRITVLTCPGAGGDQRTGFYLWRR